MSKLALGTVQFGLNYGINNTRGKIEKSDVFEILKLAQSNDIEVLDTAHAYGDSEQVIGEYLKDNKDSFKIVSKVPEIDGGQSLDQYLQESLTNLNCSKLYAYLFHSFKSYKNNPALLQELVDLKSSSKIEKIGFSLYFPSELEYLLKNNINFDILQVPYSILDQRFEPYFENLKNRGIEIHVRSVFLQGLVFKDHLKLEGVFEKVSDKLAKLNSISNKTGLSIAALCLGFVAANVNIDKVIVGVDNKDNLLENIKDASSSSINEVEKVYSQLKVLREDNEDIILPINWKTS